MMTNNTPPPDAAFTLSEMAISLFLAGFVVLGVAEASRATARAYTLVRSDLSATRAARQISAWLSRFERTEPGAIEASAQSLSTRGAGPGGLRLNSYTEELGSGGLLISYVTEASTYERRFTFGSTPTFQVEPGAYVTVSFADPSVMGYTQRLAREVPHDCRFDFVSRLCR